MQAVCENAQGHPRPGVRGEVSRPRLLALCRKWQHSPTPGAHHTPLSGICHPSMHPVTWPQSQASLAWVLNRAGHGHL